MDAKKSVGFLLAVAAAALLAGCASNQPSQPSSGAYNAGVIQPSHNSCGKNSCGGKNGCGASPSH